MKYVATRTLSIRDPHTGRIDGVVKGEVVSESRAKKFRLENFTTLRAHKAEKYTPAEAKLLAELYLELDASYNEVTEEFMKRTDSAPARVGSVQCMVRRMHRVDNYFQGAEAGVPTSDHKDFPKVYAALLELSANPVRFI